MSTPQEVEQISKDLKWIKTYSGQIGSNDNINSKLASYVFY